MMHYTHKHHSKCHQSYIYHNFIIHPWTKSKSWQQTEWDLWGFYFDCVHQTVVSLHLHTMTNTFIARQQMTPVCMRHLSARRCTLMDVQIANYAESLPTLKPYLSRVQQSVLLYGNNICPATATTCVIYLTCKVSGPGCISGHDLSV